MIDWCGDARVVFDAGLDFTGAGEAGLNVGLLREVAVNVGRVDQTSVNRDFQFG